MRRVCLVSALIACVLSAVLPARPAFAERRRQQPVETADQEVERLSNDAVLAYKEGRYEKAVQLLNRAYAIRPLAALLYNLAKAYDKQPDVVNAYEAYQKYVGSGEAEPRLEARAKERMSSLEPEYKLKKEPPKPTEAEKPPEPQRPLEPVKPAGPTPAELAARAESERLQKRRILLFSGIGGAVVGLGLIGGGLGVFASASARHDTFTLSRDETMKRQLRDSTQTLATPATVLYAIGAVLAGVGAAAIVGSFVLFQEKPTSASPASSASLAPWFSPTGAGGVASWQF